MAKISIPESLYPEFEGSFSDNDLIWRSVTLKGLTMEVLCTKPLDNFLRSVDNTFLSSQEGEDMLEMLFPEEMRRLEKIFDEYMVKYVKGGLQR